MFACLSRLIGPYMLFLPFYFALYKYLADGPLTPPEVFDANNCNRNWWINLIAMQDVIRPTEPVRYTECHIITSLHDKHFLISVKLDFFYTSTIIFNSVCCQLGTWHQFLNSPSLD